MIGIVLLILCGCLLAMASASTQPASALAPGPMHAAGLAVVVGSVAAWWSWFSRIDKVDQAVTAQGFDVLKQDGAFDVLTRSRKVSGAL